MEMTLQVTLQVLRENKVTLNSPTQTNHQTERLATIVRGRILWLLLECNYCQPFLIPYTLNLKGLHGLN